LYLLAGLLSIQRKAKGKRCRQSNWHEERKEGREGTKKWAKKKNATKKM
jgi:hypothetical protein